MVVPAYHFVDRGPRAAVLGLCLAALTGCQSLSNTSAAARVRVIDVSPDAPAVDVYQGSNAVAYNLNFGTVTSYLPITPGATTLTVDLAGSRQVLSSIEGSFAADAHYTVLVGNSIANLQQTVLLDREQVLTSKNLSAPTAAIRFVHQALRSGAVDVGSVAPMVINLLSGSNTGYLIIPACTCAVMMLPAGTAPAVAARAMHNGAQSRYVSGSARTLFLLDAQPSASSNVQVVTTIDAEPLG